MGEAALDTEDGGQEHMKGIEPVNGHSANGADGTVAPEAAFWSSLEDAKDEVRSCPDPSVGALCLPPPPGCLRKSNQSVMNDCCVW